MPVSVAFIRKLEKVSPDLREVLLGLLEELERQRAESVGKQEFDDLKNIVKELAEAQQRTSEKIEALAEAQRLSERKIHELAEAQRRTEQRLEELAEAQRKTDERLNSLALKVEELTEAQKKTDERLNSLAVKVEELAEAQRRTEQRLGELAEAQRKTDERLNSLALKVEELTEAQRKTDERLSSLAVKVEELAEAQRKTDERLNSLAVRVEELAEAQRKTDERLNSLTLRVEELAAAQERTEKELRVLALEHRKTREQLGGLAITVGYRLEDEAFRALPGLLARDHNIILEGRLRRQFVKDRNGKYIEVNIIGHGRRGEEKVTIIGEGKSQLSKKDVDRFIQNRLKRLEGVFEHIFPVLVTYMISEPDVEDYVKQKGLVLYYSFDF